MKTLCGYFAGRTKAHNTGNIFCSGTKSELLSRTTEDNGGQNTLIFGEQCSDAFRPVNFVRRKGKKVTPDFLCINGMTASGLNTICMEKDASLRANSTNFFNWIDSPRYHIE